MNKHSNFKSKLIVFIVLSTMLFSLVGCEKGENSSTPTADSSVDIESEWTKVNSTDSLLEMSRTTDYDRTYTFVVDYSDVSNEVLKNDLAEKCFTVFSQWFLSTFTFDLNLHVPLFFEKHTENTLYSEFEKSGYDREKAIKTVTQNAFILFPYKNVKLDTKITKFSINDSISVDDVVTYNELFTEYNMDRQKLGDVFTIGADVNIIVDDTFYYSYNDTYPEEIIVFEYDNHIYMHYQYLDNDLTIDILQGNPREYEGVFSLDSVLGKVTKVEKDFFYIEDFRQNKYYVSTVNLEKDFNIKPDEYVSVHYYDSSITFKQISDNINCKYLVAVDIEKESNQ